MWATMHDPYDAAYNGYGSGKEAPGIFGPGDKVYQAAHNMILSHACAYRKYRDMNQTGKNSLVSFLLLNCHIHNIYEYIVL